MDETLIVKTAMLFYGKFIEWLNENNNIKYQYLDRQN